MSTSSWGEKAAPAPAPAPVAAAREPEAAAAPPIAAEVLKSTPPPSPTAQAPAAPAPVQTWARQAATVSGGANDDGKWAIRGQKLPEVSPQGSSSTSTSNSGGWARGKSLAPTLYQPGEAGENVTRFTAGSLLQQRLEFIASPLSWTAPDGVKWTDDDRVPQIMNNHTAGRIGGDVTRKGETAPELKDCKPLEVNEETRWKSGIIGGEALEGEGAINQKALVILNKITMTNFDKLASEFTKCGILSTPEFVKMAVELVVTKAQQEAHFSEMYAKLCMRMSTDLKNFKKVVVERCQTGEIR